MSISWHHTDKNNIIKKSWITEIVTDCTISDTNLNFSTVQNCVHYGNGVHILKISLTGNTVSHIPFRWNLPQNFSPPNFLMLLPNTQTASTANTGSAILLHENQ